MICPHCGEKIEVFKTGGGEKAAKELDVPFLGAIPLEAVIGRLGDMGKTFTKNETSAAKVFDRLLVSSWLGYMVWKLHRWTKIFKCLFE